MQPNQPTPGEAAVVLQTFLAEHGVDVTLGIAREAIARLHGLATGMPVRDDPAPAATSLCASCDAPLEGDYCTSEHCRYFDWPQFVGRDDLKVFSVDEVEAMYRVRMRADASVRHAVPLASADDGRPG